MTETPRITIDRRLFVALVEALKLARYAIDNTGSRMNCGPHSREGVAHTLNRAIAEGTAAQREVRS